MRVSDHNKVIVDMTSCVFDSLICKLVQPLSKNLLLTISRPILYITALTRCPNPCFQVQRSLKDHSWINFNYVCSWQAMQLTKCQYYRKCDIYAVSQPILQVRWEGFWGHLLTKSCSFYDQRLIWGSIQGIVNKEIPLSAFTNSFTDPDKQQARMIFS